MNLKDSFITLGVDYLATDSELSLAYDRKLSSYDISKYANPDDTLKNRFAKRISECQEALTVIKSFDADNSSYTPTDYMDLKVAYQRSLLSLTSGMEELESPVLYHSANRIIRGCAINMEIARSEEELQELLSSANEGIKTLKSQSPVNTGLVRAKGGNKNVL